MFLILHIFGLYRVDWKGRREKLALIYFVMCVCTSAVCVYHAIIWSENFGDYSFHLRSFLAVLHIVIFFSTPVLNLVQFGLINRFDFSLWNKNVSEELLRFNIRVICEDTRYVKAFNYLCVVLIAGISERILRMYRLERVYDYFPLIMIELWCLLPVLDYLRVMFITLSLHRVVMGQIVLCKKLKTVYARDGCGRCWPLYLREYAISAELTLKRLKKFHKVVLNVCYVVIPKEYGFSIFLLIISYTFSFLHDVCLFLPMTMDYRILFFSACRTVFKFVFLIVFFVIGEKNSVKIKNGIRDIHDVVIVEPALPIDRQLKNLSSGYLQRDLRFEAYATLRITCRQYLSIISVLVGYLILQIQVQIANQ